VVATTTEVLKTVRDFVADLEALGKVRVKQAILYGSYARGRAHRWGDIDLLVVSEDFAGMSPLKRIRLVAQATFQSRRHLQAVTCTPKELEEAGPASFLAHIKRTGTVIWQAE
jgi:predicted nucleotidyltransferase